MQDLENKLGDADSKNISVARRIYDFGNKYINYKMGLVGTVIMGGTVFGINYLESHELLGSFTAASKQAGYTFLVGGAVMRGCEYLATTIHNKAKALISSILIPSIISISLTYGVHNLKGTPDPEKSTIPSIVLLFPATAYWGYKKRKQSDARNL